LPNERFQDQWDQLVFGRPIAEDMLRTLVRSKTLRQKIQLRHWPNNILLYGPPGTGKTTLALGLAQKLSIRLQNSYEGFLHVQINSHALLSKSSSESGKEVSQLFKRICNLAMDSSRLVVTTFDDVESIVPSRQRATNKNEAENAIRFTNEFLRGLDKLDEAPNVIVIATSNLVGNMDDAFLDRFSYQQLIDTSGEAAAYELLRRAINELIEKGFV
ncbi:AAA-domain-containing protein, partial [Byssothecium circinans]